MKENEENQDKENSGADRFAVSIKDVCLSNSWALQAVLQYLDEQNPGARDQIWEKYLELKKISEEAER